MHALLCVLFITACVLADKTDIKRNKLPFVADAVGNSLPPPSSVPASVGSPVNLLTPDRYEFYTFDESGELVKKLMTLEEIQAIVAAGEEGEGLVTFANDNQPTIAFNFSQPSYTKVHNVVTNVQNVLKAQMEAHKNKPQIQPTFDTPDVSDTWSLILPSIFGNTGVDIVPDKSSGTFTEPETDTLDLDHTSEVEESDIIKEDNNQMVSSSSTTTEKTVTQKLPTTVEIKEIPTSTTTLSTTTTTTSTSKPSTTRLSTTSTSTTHKPSTTIRPLTTRRPQTTVTEKLRNITTTAKISTSPKPSIITTTTITTSKPEITTKLEISTSTNKDTEVQQTSVANTEKNEVQYEKLSTFIPVSTVKYVSERVTTLKPTSINFPIVYATTTKKPVPITTASVNKNPNSEPTTQKPAFSTFSYISSSYKDSELEKANITTITTQSVSPSTTVSSTEFVNAENMHLHNIMEDKPTFEEDNEKDNMPMIPLFDVAQSISQIASDLGGNYRPVPTTSNLLDTANVIDLESKENLDLDIPSASSNDTEIKISNTSDTSSDNFVKISTLDPHVNNINNDTNINETIVNINDEIDITTQTVEKSEVTTISTEETTMDSILSESMGDLLSQVVNEGPQTIEDLEKSSDKSETIAPTDTSDDITTTDNVASLETTSEVSLKVKKETMSSTTEASIEQEIFNKKYQPPNEIISSNNPAMSNGSSLINTDISSYSDNNTVSETTEINSSNTAIDIEQAENERGDINFVQISMLANNNELKEKNNPNENESKVEDKNNITNITDDLKPNVTLTEEELKTDSKSEVNSTELLNIETTTLLLSTDIQTTTVKSISENKYSPSKFNKVNFAGKLSTSSKKDKFPEPLPKVDDFKKKIQKVNIAEEEIINERNNSWKLVPTLSPPKVNEIPKDKQKAENHYTPDNENKEIDLEHSQENQGLEVTTKDLGEDIAQFTELCNELAFRYWNVMVENIDKRRSFVLSPYSITSMLAMMFMGAKGATSGEMNEILKLDDMVTFNPHFTLKNISDSIDMTSHSGIAVSAFIRELYSDRNKGKILTFYKERAQHFYNGHVEEINFKLISDIIRRRTNLLVKRYTWGKIAEFMKTNNIVMQPPLAAFSANIFQTDCTGSSVDGRDGEMYFVVSPNVRQRRLVPVPAVVYKNGFLAGYDPILDATAAALGNTNSIISILFLMPGQQGNVVHADDLEKLEQRLLSSNPTTPTWGRLLRTLLPRTGLELQIPRFSHKSIFNVSSTLQKMGLKDLFDADHADLGGLNGPSKDLFLSDMIQLSTFVTCGEGVVGEQHHIEEYPETLGAPQRRRTSRWAKYWDEPRDYQRAFHDPHDVGEAMNLPLHLRPRQARLPSRSAQAARLKFDRPFLYFVRHNPSGMILYFGRFNPRLLP